MVRDIIGNNENAKPNGKEMEVLHRYFPQCFNSEGKFDLDRFKDIISDEVSVVKEGHSLNFLGKSYAKLLSSIDTTTVIRPDIEHNSKEDNRNSRNLYISGDNMDALKHLLNSYSGKIKCIYIDPPYNTGSDRFVYNDNFGFTVEELSARLSVGVEHAQKLMDMTSRGSSSHSAWLTFMSSRLQLAKDLLTDDGVIFISIDDNEQANLKLLCDGIFGEENFVADLIWQKKFSRSNDAAYYSTMHDYILCYCKHNINFNPDGWKIGLLPREDELPKGYSNPDNDPRGPWTSVILSAKSGSDSLLYEITTPKGRKVLPPSGRYWSCSKDTFIQWQAENRIWFGSDGNGTPRKKTFLSEVQEGLRPNTIILHSEGGHNQEGKQELKALFGGVGVFDGPKPVRLLKHLLSIANLNDGDIVLDFFSGSATTADAVMQLNAEDKTKGLRYILVQLPEVINEKTTAYDEGYRTIDEIGRKRIELAAEKIRKETSADIDYGFRHYILEEPSGDTLDRLDGFSPDVMFADEDILEEFGKKTVLETWCVRDGYGFGAECSEVKLASYTAYQCGRHLYFVDSGLNEDDMVALIDKYNSEPAFCPDQVVLFGYSFSFSQTEMLRRNLVILRDAEKNLKINVDSRY